MQGKIFAIPYAAWIAAFVFDVLIIIDSYPLTYAMSMELRWFIQEYDTLSINL